MVLIDGAEAPETEPPSKAPVTSALKLKVLAALTDEARSRADIARAVGRDPKDRSVGRVLIDLADEGRAERTGTETRPLWKVAGGKPPSADATCHLQDGLDDLAPEGPPPNALGDALPAKACRCERPLPAPDPDDGELRCTHCGHATGGWTS